ncbi:MAG: aldolase [candidate division WOR-3 bacterium]
MQDFIRIGKKLAQDNLIYANFGNMSERVGEKILITGTGTMLDELKEEDIIEVPLEGPSQFDFKASCELIVHRSIYKETPACAIIHVHSPFAVLLSIIAEKSEIVPKTMEGEKIIGVIPIVEGESGTPRLASAVSSALREHKTCIVKNHGTFVRGSNIIDAYINVTTLEHFCKIFYYYELYKK